MQTESLLAATEFCTLYQVELSFIQSLHQSGLLQAERLEESLFIPLDEVPSLEKMIRLRYDMDINIEGIETITHLLQQVADLQQQVLQLKNRLSLYE
jgi:MerR HTH family regulatory protein